MIIGFHQQSNQLEWNEVLPPQWVRRQPERADGGGIGGWMLCLSSTPSDKKAKFFASSRKEGAKTHWQLSTINGQLTQAICLLH